MLLLQFNKDLGTPGILAVIIIALTLFLGPSELSLESDLTGSTLTGFILPSSHLRINIKSSPSHYGKHLLRVAAGRMFDNNTWLVACFFFPYILIAYLIIYSSNQIELSFVLVSVRHDRRAAITPLWYSDLLAGTSRAAENVQV